MKDKITVLDGAMGSRLMEAGMKMGECPEKWILSDPSREMLCENIQRGYIRAGADIIYAPTFGANPGALKRYGLAEKTEEYNARLAGISRRAAEAEGKNVLVAGDISCTGCFLEPYGTDTFDDLYDIFARQIKALDKAGVDLFVIETQISLSEARAALLAVKELTDKKAFVTVTLSGTKTMSGNDVGACCVSLLALGADAFGINCSSGPDEMAEPVRILADLMPDDIPLIVKPNLPLDGSKPLSPSEFAESVSRLAALGASAVGGCCQTSDAYIAELKKAVTGTTPGKRLGKWKNMCASDREAFCPVRSMTVSAELPCDSDLCDAVFDVCEDIICVRVSSPEDAAYLTEAVPFIKTPLMLVSDFPDALESALRVYPGRAIISENCRIPAQALEKIVKKYGPATIC